MQKKIMRMMLASFIALMGVACNSEIAQIDHKKSSEIDDFIKPIESGKDYIVVYYSDQHAETLLSKKVLVPEINEETIINELIGMKVLNRKVDLNCCTEKKEEDKVFLALDFNEAFQEQLNRSGTTGYRMLLGCVVNTFLSAFRYDSLCMTVNGQTIESGHSEGERLWKKDEMIPDISVLEEVNYKGQLIKVNGKKIFSEMGFASIYLPQIYKYYYDLEAEVATIDLKKETTLDQTYFAFSKSDFSLKDTVSGLQLQSAIPLSLEKVQIGIDKQKGIQLSGDQNGVYHSFYIMEFEEQVYLIETYYEGESPDSYIPALLAMIKQFYFVR